MNGMRKESIGPNALSRAGSSIVAAPGSPTAASGTTTAAPRLNLPRVNLDEAFVFLSYSSKWQLPSMIGFTLLKSARQVSRHVMCPPKSLTPAEIKGYVWYDKNEIRAGEDWDSQIGVGLRKCSCAIFCLSPNFFDSVNCKGELKAIRRRLERKEQVQLFPVTMAECPVPDDCFYALSGDSLQRVLLTDGPGTQTWNEAIDSLVQPLQESFMAHTPPSQATPALLTRPRSFSEAHLQDMQPVTPTHGGLSSNQRKLLYLIARICGYLPPKRGPDGLGRTRSASWLRAHPLSNPDTPRRERFVQPNISRSQLAALRGVTQAEAAESIYQVFRMWFETSPYSALLTWKRHAGLRGFGRAASDDGSASSESFGTDFDLSGLPSPASTINDMTKAPIIALPQVSAKLGALGQPSCFSLDAGPEDLTPRIRECQMEDQQAPSLLRRGGAEEPEQLKGEGKIPASERSLPQNKSEREKFRWISSLALHVWVFEAIQAGCFEGYTLTPYIEIVGVSQVFMLCSNEARRDLQVLQDSGHLAHLRVQDALHRYESNWQVEWYAEDASAVISSLRAAESGQVDRLMGVEPGADVIWNGPQEAFIVRRPGLADATSRVTELLDIDEKVLAPYIPGPLRPQGATEQCTVYDQEWIERWLAVDGSPIDSNSPRSSPTTKAAPEVVLTRDLAASWNGLTGHSLALRAAQVNARTIQRGWRRYKAMCRLRLSGITILTGEWVPMDVNDLIVLQQEVSYGTRPSRPRLTGQTTTLHTDRESVDKVALQVPEVSGLDFAAVRVLDSEFSEFVNFEAYMTSGPAAGSPVEKLGSIEHIGVHIDKSGNAIYGTKVRHVGNCGDAEVPVDEVVRAWAALLRCSCNVIGKLLSTHQQGFLKFLQHGHGSLGQKKFDVILAEVATCNPEAGPVLTLDADSQAIFPPMGPEKLLGNSDFLVELFPILGDVQHAYEIEKNSMMVLGTHGVLITGPGSPACEPGVLRYLSFMNCSLFMTSFHRKVLRVEATLRSIRTRLEDRSCTDELRSVLSQTSMDFLKTMTSTLEEHPAGTTRSRLEKLFACDSVGRVLLERLQGINSLIETFVQEIALLRTALEGTAARNSADHITQELRLLLGGALGAGGGLAGLAPGVFV